MLIYDGLHYDSLAVSAFQGAPEELDITVFTIAGEHYGGRAPAGLLQLPRIGCALHVRAAPVRMPLCACTARLRHSHVSGASGAAPLCVLCCRPRHRGDHEGRSKAGEVLGPERARAAGITPTSSN